MPGTVFHSEHNPSPEAQVSSGLLVYRRLAHRLWTVGLDLLFPPRCAGCGRVDSYWCATCQRNLAEIPIALQTRQLDALPLVACSGIHTGLLREAVQGLKYSDTRVLAQPLGERLLACLTSLNWKFDMLVPVPLHTKRLKERGYNQSQLLAEYVASHLAIPCVPTAVTRQRHTESQVGLGATERRSNVEDAFEANPTLVANQTLVLLDDVCTTGATLSACAQAALAAGAVRVYGLTVTAAQG